VLTAFGVEYNQNAANSFHLDEPAAAPNDGVMFRTFLLTQRKPPATPKEGEGGFGI
jgi:hypothetical protein